MSMDYWEYQQEAAYEAYMDEMYENEFRERAIEEFTEERLRSYYLENPEILINSLRVLNEAKSLLPTSPTASLLMSAIAIETGFKSGILKPIIYGFIHSDVAAEAISNITLKQNGVDRFGSLLVTLLSDLSEIDINTYKRKGSSQNLWVERTDIQKVRNKISHRADICTVSEAQMAFYVGSGVLLELIPDILSTLGFHINIKGEVVSN